VARTVDEIQKLLAEPFSASDIEWRIGRKSKAGDKASVLAYVTNRAIMNRLDGVVGIGGWHNTYQQWRGKGVVCGLSLFIGEDWLTKYDGADDTDIESTKGGLSDSMKRAAVQWGIGRYLYNLEEVWVPIDQYGKFKDPPLPSWALPESEKARKPPPQSPPPTPKEPPASPPPATDPPKTINDAQMKRLYTVATANGWSHEQVKATLAASKGKYASSRDIPVAKYDAVVGFFEANKPPAPPEPAPTTEGGSADA
jgi:hypothetical protein